MSAASSVIEATPGLQLRAGQKADAQACGRILYEAFLGISSKHNFPPDFPNVESAVGMISGLLDSRGFYSVVAERDGEVVGSNFMDERNVIAGIGPITVDPACQDGSVGRRLMTDVLERAEARQHPGVRLVQAAYHSRSLALYAKLGFDIREPLATLQGTPLRQQIPGYAVRAASMDDLPACNQLCLRIHGHDRGGELAGAIKHGSARVVVHNGRITGYCTTIAFFGHAVGESNREIMALIANATEFAGPGLLLPIRNSELFRWCLTQNLRVVQTMTLMSRGLYNEPQGAFLPSVFY
jgi:predicted N-acetyltransferase YhbS